MYVTLNGIKDIIEDENDIDDLLASLNKTECDECPLSLSYIYSVKGFIFTVQCLQLVEGHTNTIKEFSRKLILLSLPRKIKNIPSIVKKYIITEDESLKTKAANAVNKIANKMTEEDGPVIILLAIAMWLTETNCPAIMYCVMDAENNSKLNKKQDALFLKMIK